MKNFRKSPPADWLATAARKHAKSVTEQQGKALPASVMKMEGRIATVQFEIDCNPALPPLPVPVAESEYVRTPIQPGCKGVVISAASSLEQMSALGAHRPVLGVGTCNLSACLFLPLTNAQWDALDNNMLHLYGVAGAEMKDSIHGSSVLRLLKDEASLSNGQAGLDLKGDTATVSGQTVKISGKLIINGQEYRAHTHTNGHNGAPTGGVI